MNDLNKQRDVESTSFFSSRQASHAGGRTRKASQPPPSRTQEHSEMIRMYLENVPSKLNPASLKAEILKAQYLGELDRMTRERLY